jgi:hypothetical protein
MSETGKYLFNREKIIKDLNEIIKKKNYLILKKKFYFFLEPLSIGECFLRILKKPKIQFFAKNQKFKKKIFNTNNFF